jgi:hypothetical protein
MLLFMSGPRGNGGADGDEPVVPTAEESWERHTRILDLVEEMRTAHERRKRGEPEPPAR